MEHAWAEHSSRSNMGVVAMSQAEKGPPTVLASKIACSEGCSTKNTNQQLSTCHRIRAILSGSGKQTTGTAGVLVIESE
eukprot:6197461-Pleurochrysis_carterae.AAC.1